MIYMWIDWMGKIKIYHKYYLEKINMDCSEGECNPRSPLDFLPTHKAIKPKEEIQPIFSQNLETEETSKIDDASYKTYAMANSAGVVIIVILILFVLLVAVFYLVKPHWCLKRRTNKIDNGKLLMTAFIFALFMGIGFYLIRAYSNSSPVSTK